MKGLVEVAEVGGDRLLALCMWRRGVGIGSAVWVVLPGSAGQGECQVVGVSSSYPSSPHPSNLCHFCEFLGGLLGSGFRGSVGWQGGGVVSAMVWVVLPRTAGQAIFHTP